MDRRAQWATVHEVHKESDTTEHAYNPFYQREMLHLFFI